jgi:GNAT superfamily N-acetyltransferase
VTSPEPPAGVELRDEPSDGPAARALFAEYMALVAERLGEPYDDRDDIFATPEAFSGPGAAFLVLYDGGSPAGCGALRPLGEGTGEIKRMFVSASGRGRGHGRRLLEALERRAAAAGHRRIRLFTTDVLHEARGLYAAAGYRVVDTPREGTRQDYWMEKELPPPS